MTHRASQCHLPKNELTESLYGLSHVQMETKETLLQSQSQGGSMHAHMHMHACTHAHLSWEIGQTSLQQGQETDGPLFTSYPTLHLLKDEGGNCRGTRMKPRLVVGPSGEGFIRPVLATFPQQQYNVHANRVPNLYNTSKQARCEFGHCHSSV